MFKKLALYVFCCLALAASARAQTSLSGIPTDNNGNRIPSGSLLFTLTNCGATPSIPPTQTFLVSSLGAVTGLLRNNNGDGCLAGKSYFVVTAQDANGRLVWSRNYRVTASSWTPLSAVLFPLPTPVVQSSGGGTTVTGPADVPGLLDGTGHFSSSLMPITPYALPAGLSAGSANQFVIDSTGAVHGAWVVTSYDNYPTQDLGLTGIYASTDDTLALETASLPPTTLWTSDAQANHSQFARVSCAGVVRAAVANSSVLFTLSWTDASGSSQVSQNFDLSSAANKMGFQQFVVALPGTAVRYQTSLTGSGSYGLFCVVEAVR